MADPLLIAFIITTAAGLSTTLGTLVVFIPKFYDPRVLGISLALAAGVMVYVSFVEIFGKGLSEFEVYFDDARGLNRSLIPVDDYEPPSEAYACATATFFAGVLVTWLIDKLINYLYSTQKSAKDHEEEIFAMNNAEELPSENDTAVVRPTDHVGIFEVDEPRQPDQSSLALGILDRAANTTSSQSLADMQHEADMQQQRLWEGGERERMLCREPGRRMPDDPSGEKRSGQQDEGRHIAQGFEGDMDPPTMMIEASTQPSKGMHERSKKNRKSWKMGKSKSGSYLLPGTEQLLPACDLDDEPRSDSEQIVVTRLDASRGKTFVDMGEEDLANSSEEAADQSLPSSPTATGNTRNSSSAIDKNRHKLIKTALITGTAIALHNFPEGLATFVATARDPSVGAPIAIAIAIHNIPEGICVAVPIYFATKNKWRAFVLGTLSGLTEPFAGAIGWGILSGSGQEFSALIYAVLFGLVSGMMVYISFRELLPTARGYDPGDKYVSLYAFVGMVVMAMSLVLFQI